MLSVIQPLSSFATLLSPLQEGVELVRLRLGRQVVSLISSDPQRDAHHFAQPVGDPGLFTPDSPVWEVHADAAMFVGGIRALLLQAMHPLAMTGVAEHSNYKQEPLRRLQRTAMFIRDTTYGNTRQAEAAIERVRRLHRGVRGKAADGRSYSADDPALLRWVHAAEIESFLIAHQRYGAAPLSAARLDRYVDEMAEIALRLGADWVPRRYRALHQYMKDVRPELQAGKLARETAEWLLRTAAHPNGWLPQMVLNGAAIGLLPAWIRRELGLAPLPWLDPLLFADPLIVRPAANALVRTLGWVLAPHPYREAARHRWAVRRKPRRPIKAREAARPAKRAAARRRA